VAARTNGSERFGTERLFLADSRLAAVVLNDVRHRALRGVFHCAPDADNLLTAVLALSAASVAYETGRRMLHPHITRGDLLSGGLLVREAAIGVAGPGARTTPLFGTLLGAAIIGRLSLPVIREAVHVAREAEHRLRLQRIRQYMGAGRDGAPVAR